MLSSSQELDLDSQKQSYIAYVPRPLSAPKLSLCTLPRLDSLYKSMLLVPFSISINLWVRHSLQNMLSKSAAPSQHPYTMLGKVTTLNKMKQPPWSGELSASQIPADWHRAHKSCQRYFLSHGQHSKFVRTLCAFINIQLPHQKNPTSPITATVRWLLSLGNRSSQALSLVPYIRRLVCTSNDTADILKEFFGGC